MLRHLSRRISPLRSASSSSSSLFANAANTEREREREGAWVDRTADETAGVWVRRKDPHSIAIYGPNNKWHIVRSSNTLCTQANAKPDDFHVKVCDVNDLKISVTETQLLQPRARQWLRGNYGNMIDEWTDEEMYMHEMAEKIERSFVNSKYMRVVDRRMTLLKLGVYSDPEERTLDADVRRMLKFLNKEAHGGRNWDDDWSEEADLVKEEELEDKKEMLAEKKPQLHELADAFRDEKHCTFTQQKIDELAQTLIHKGWKLGWFVDEWEMTAGAAFWNFPEARELFANRKKMENPKPIPPETIIDGGHHVIPFLYLSCFPHEESSKEAVKKIKRSIKDDQLLHFISEEQSQERLRKWERDQKGDMWGGEGII